MPSGDLYPSIDYWMPHEQLKMLIPVMLPETGCESGASLKKKPIFDYDLSLIAANSLSKHCLQPGGPVIEGIATR